MVTLIKLAVVVVALWNRFGDVVVTEMAITWLRGKLEKNLSPQISPMCGFCFVSFFLVCEFRSMFSDVFSLHCYIANPYTLLKFETIGKLRPFNCS